MEPDKTQPRGHYRSKPSMLLGVAAVLVFGLCSLTACGASGEPEKSQGTTLQAATATATTATTATTNVTNVNAGQKPGCIRSRPIDTPSTSFGRLISNTFMGNPTVGGHYLFWTDQCTSATSATSATSGNPAMAIYGYDLNASYSFLVKMLPLGATSLATDGQTLVWVEGTEYAGDSIHSYNLSSGQEATVISSGTGEYDQIAVDKDILYYDKPDTGLVARNLSTGEEELVSADGVYPVAADGKLLWLTQEQQCSSDGRCISSWKLYLAQLNDLKHSTYLATSGPDRFSGPAVSGDKIVWADAWWADDFTIYDIATNTSTVVKTEGVSIPIIQNSVVVWAEGPGVSRGWSIKSSGITANSSSTISTMSTIVSEHNEATRAWGIAEANNRTLVYTIGDQLLTSVMLR